MSTYETSHTIEGPFVSEDPLRDLIRFFEANGYTVKSDADGAPSHPIRVRVEASQLAEPSEHDEDSEAEDSDEVDENDDADTVSEAAGDASSEKATTEHEVTPDSACIRATLQRGQSGASIWSSNMTDLLADLTLSLTEEGVRMDFVIETTLQHFTDEDKRFWQKEARHAESFALGRVDAVIDWRENEAHRTDQTQSDIVVLGLQLAVAAALFVFVVYMVFVA